MKAFPLITVTGPSGSGKTTMVRMLCRYHGLREAVSVTTRPIRESEVDGKDYHFISREAFVRLREEGKLYEHVEFDGNYYGISKEVVDDCVRKSPTLLIVEPGGIHHIRDSYKLGVVHHVVIIYPERLCAMQMLKRGDDFDRVSQRILNDRDAFSPFSNLVPEDCIFIDGTGMSISEYVDKFLAAVPEIRQPAFSTPDGDIVLPHSVYAELFGSHMRKKIISR